MCIHVLVQIKRKVGAKVVCRNTLSCKLYIGLICGQSIILICCSAPVRQYDTECNSYHWEKGWRSCKKISFLVCHVTNYDKKSAYLVQR